MDSQRGPLASPPGRLGGGPDPGPLLSAGGPKQPSARVRFLDEQELDAGGHLSNLLTLAWCRTETTE